jgi:uncharacterized membrane protein HdeD (DUF308 family)
MKAQKAEEEIRNSLRIAKTNKFIAAVCLIVMGAVLFLWSDTAINMICKAVAAVVAAAGIAVVIFFFFSRARVYGNSAVLFGGVTMLVMGMYLFFRPEILASLIPTIIGIIVLVTGLVDLSEGMRIARQRSGGTAIAMFIAAAEIILGVVFVIHPIFIENILMKLMAIVLVADGASDIWIMCQIGKAEKPLEAAAAVARGEYEEGEVTPLSHPGADGAAPADGYTTIPRGKSEQSEKDSAEQEKSTAGDAFDTVHGNAASSENKEGSKASGSKNEAGDPMNGIEADAADAGVNANQNVN